MIGRKGEKPEKQKPLKQQKPAKEPKAPKATKEPRVKADKNAGTGMTLAPRRGGGVPVGYAPRATLMPPEVGVRKRAATVRRRAILAVLLAVVVAVVGTGAAFVFAASRTVVLAGVQAETQTILQKQQQFSDVRSADATLQTLRGAQRYATSTEILWMPDVIDKLYAIVPEGVTLGAYALESGTPVAPIASAEIPLRSSYVASANLTVRAGDLALVDEWIARMPEITGVVDAYVTDATRDDEFGDYELHILVTLDQRAQSFRYDPDGAEAAAEQAAVEEAPAGDAGTAEPAPDVPAGGDQPDDEEINQ